MSRKSERLFSAITQIDDRYVEQAATAHRMRHPARRWIAAAAALALVLTGGYGIRQWRLGADHTQYNGGSGSGADGSSTFLSYAGPVFPLSLAEENAAITATRAITMDFSPWVGRWVSNEERLAEDKSMSESARAEMAQSLAELYPDGGDWERSTDLLVRDQYVLKNTSDTAQTVTLRYPFVSSALDLDRYRPALTVDGVETPTTLHAGAYVGGFQDTEGNDTDDEEMSWNLSEPNGWEGYQALLGSGAYERGAFSAVADLSQIPVVVYEVTEITGPEPTQKIPNPTMGIHFSRDYDRTAVLSYNFNGGRYDQLQGTQQVNCSVPNPDWRDYGQRHVLVVLGDDISELTIQGYQDGGCDRTLHGVTAQVTRYESDLARVLHSLLEDYRSFGAEYDDAALHERVFIELLTTYGVLSDRTMARYQHGSLEELMTECLGMDRVWYGETTYTIPPGGSCVVTATMNKAPSFDFYCAHTENQGVYGYDLVTKLGSRLSITAQTATLEDRGQIELVRQNFGFTPNDRTVRLDSAVEHYYLEVRRRSES